MSSWDILRKREKGREKRREEKVTRRCVVAQSMFVCFTNGVHLLDRVEHESMVKTPRIDSRSKIRHP